MKKTKLSAIAAIAAAAALIFTACMASGKENATPSPVSQSDLSPIATPGLVYSGEISARRDAEADFIRVGWTESIASTPAERITDVRAFSEKVLSQLENSERKDAAERKYSEAFFKDNSVVLFYVSFSSGSIQPGIKSITGDDGVITVEVEGHMEGDVGTCDMASYMVLVPINNARYPMDSKIEITGAGIPTGKPLQDG